MLPRSNASKSTAAPPASGAGSLYLSKRVKKFIAQSFLPKRIPTTVRNRIARDEPIAPRSSNLNHRVGPNTAMGQTQNGSAQDRYADGPGDPEMCRRPHSGRVKHRPCQRGRRPMLKLLQVVHSEPHRIPAPSRSPILEQKLFRLRGACFSRFRSFGCSGSRFVFFLGFLFFLHEKLGTSLEQGIQCPA